jgi:hypothetical protein
MLTEALHGQYEQGHAEGSEISHRASAATSKLNPL